MTFRCALETGLPFRLRGEPEYLKVKKDGSIVRFEIKDEKPVFISYADRLSDEWETLPLSEDESK